MISKLTVLHFLIFTISISSCTNKKNGNKSIIKTEKAIRCFYKMGIPDKTCDTTTTNYNALGKPIEEISKDNKRIFVYKEDTLLISETQYRLSDSTIWYKKNITYNDFRKIETIKIYASFDTSQTPGLVAGMKIFYDLNKKISQQKYFGAIKYNGEEKFDVISTDPEADSSNAKYSRNKLGKISKIYFNNDTTDKIVYLYNSEGNLISINKGIGSLLLPIKTYYYTKGKVTKIVDQTSSMIKTYNEKGNAIEIKNLFSLTGKSDWKMKYTHYSDGNIKDIIKYNYMGEPLYIDKFIYTFQ